ncbi:MAG: tripartite tricarboxylate transporter substrate binding protein [Hydrogenophaga sp.]|uniref:Bug family tripartite tricarboxylate transporter substrate binding protein n=1 Tax=Hydrogenophaga sp. TaxID=1904254 RepID=UPI00272394F8|nr:tripartite tricarboxylate transporter substrate binding protein [Hydrogenophaga sp.]MDO9131529.1 tripartite tricarboxylate transporter substrate binding protein [Hydrogenophaga sp.]MDP2074436.1 tripartite tricarboxylate transporter substrate binding protein [Hydrogenophaga sp.]MDP3108260.1 tripartite tricarboxylate transporter substrate binding protein [Hydrogenophaga sp.]MDP3202544.1 tripartite tricarboxylate transporter substrate binding protein [Hydrogenophaga sp.]MDZ4396680.1 tripartite
MKKLICALGASMAMTTAMAWPDKTVTIVVPFPPGGSTDVIARTLQPRLQEKLGGTFVVENKAGATGTIGATHVVRSAPDGHTLFVSSLGPFVIAPHLFKVTYDAPKDFDFISVAVQAPNVLVVPAASPHKSMADVTAFQKANPGKMTFASSGNGSSDHLTAELYWQQTGTTGVHVPYRGGGPVMTDLLGAQVDSSFMNINTAMPQIVAGKLRALSITSAQRSPLLPNVPTLDELGIKDANVYSWQAVAGPKGMSADVKAKLHAAIRDTLNDPAVKPKLLEVGFEIVASTPAEFTAFQAAEFTRWQNLIKSRNIKVD